MRIMKVLYGCIQSALQWYKLFKTTLEKEGFVINPYDPYPYTDLLKDLGDYYVLIGRLAWEKYMGRNT